MSNFINAIELVLKHEGGFSNHPDDHGGPTNFGITQAEYSLFLKRDTTVDDVKNMPIDSAMLIFKSKYWDHLQLDQVKSPIISTVILDQGVLRGTNTVIKNIQSILKLDVDGLVGQQTINAINNYPNDGELALKIICRCQQAYVNICTANPSQLVFLSGWINRTQDLLRLLV